MLRIALFILFSVFVSGTACAQLSFLDPAFGNNGVVLRSVRSYAAPREMIRQDDGKLLLVGNSMNDGLVTRFLSNGQPDYTFGDSSNVIIVNPFSGGGQFTDVIELGNKIIVGGWEPVTTNVLAALKQDGSIDSSFGVNGIKRFTFPNVAADQRLRSLARVNDSQFVAMGLCVNDGSNFDIFVAKLDRYGNPVTGFGNNGHVIIDHENRYEFGYDLTVDTKGNIYIVGATQSLSGSKSAMVVKLRPDGSSDAAFAAQGKLIQDITLSGGAASDWDEWYTIAWQRGDILVGGYSGTSAAGVMIMQRMNSNGRIDSSFADNGLMRSNLCATGPGVAINKILVMPDNKIRTGCTANCGSNFRMFLSGFTASGKLDSAFGVNGNIVLPGLQGYDEQTTGLILNPDGTICQSAISWLAPGSVHDIAIVKYKKWTPEPTGIETPDQRYAQIFPNVLAPGASIHLLFKERLRDQGQAAIFDISGRQLLSLTLPRNVQQTSISIPRHTAPGMYLLRLVLNGEIRTERITVK